MVAAVADLTQSGDCGGFGRCTRPPAANGSDFVLNYSLVPTLIRLNDYLKVIFKKMCMQKVLISKKKSVHQLDLNPRP